MTPLPNLPITETLPALRTVLEAGGNAVVVAPPGAGKTTLVPLALLDTLWRSDGRIIMGEPRRLATRAVATRMASLLGETPGGRIGYRTRLDAAVSDATLVEVVTEGLLVRRLESDPGLDGIACVILDEIHERSVESDLALAFCLDLQRVLRPELRIVAMSATADGARLATMMNATVVESAGRQFPVSVRHARRDLPAVRDLPDAMTRAIRAALAEDEGDILAFLPGMAEIRRTERALGPCGAAVLPLHGDLPSDEQDRALRPAAEGRRVVLATSIAETSLTVPGVRLVIDGGWRRAPRLDPASGLTRLTTLRISRAAAGQRAGRAGREAPGIAIRLWTEALHRGLSPYDRPEILEADLAPALLDCAAWGTPPGELPFQDPPPPAALAAARTLLEELGALDAAGRITWTGRRMARLGAHPRLSAMMLAADSDPEIALACNLAALLEERDPLRGPDTPADLSLRLEAIANGDPAADRGALARIRQAAGQYRRRVPVPPGARAAGDPGKLVAAAFPDRVAQRRGEPGSFRLSGGGGARLPVTDPLAKAGLLAVASLELKASARIRLASPLDPEKLPAALESKVQDTAETALDPATGNVLARRKRRLGALVLRDRTGPADPAEAADTLLRVIVAQALGPLPWTDGARQFQARVAWMRGLAPAGWPDLSDPELQAEGTVWLRPHLLGLSRLSDVATLSMEAILRNLLPWPLPRTLDEELPTHLLLPNGRAPIDYAQPVPVASARAQAFFGLRATPCLAGGRIPLRIALLSPAGRPVAITADLAGFWRGAWAEVRRDMRGGYPKHAWPDDGGAAADTH